MPPVRAPSDGNIFSDLGATGSSLIAGSLDRQQQEREQARQAALDADKLQNSEIARALQEAQTGLIGTQRTELAGRAEREREEEERDRESRRSAAQSVVDSMNLSPERRTALVDFFVTNKRFPPGMDITPPIDRAPDALEQLGFKADVKRKFLLTLSADNVLELTNQDLISQADSEIRRLVSSNPGADFELIQSTVIDELERAIKTLEQKKKAAEQGEVKVGGQVVTFPDRVQDVIDSGGREQ